MTAQKKVLIITYYWPPAGGSAIQRILKFVKFMRLFGWEPVILTVENGEYPALDASFEKEIPEGIHIYKTKAIQPFGIYRKLTGKKKAAHITNDVFTQKNKNILDRFSKWMRLNLFIPDARIGWYPYAVKEARRIIEQEQIDLIFSSSPPHSLQVIAKKIAKQNRIKWVADFRDPWSELAHYQINKRSWLTKKADNLLERSVFRSADCIIAAAHDYARCIQSHVNRDIEIIYNGYDTEDMPHIVKAPNDSFRITYTGEASKDRIPYALLNALCRLKNEKILLQFIGNSCQELKEEVKKLNLSDKVIFQRYIPHAEAIAKLASSDLLLLIINQVSNGQGIVPGKIFEYMGIRKPILCIGDPNGESAQLIKDSNSGFCADYNDEDKIYSLLIRLYSGEPSGLTFNIEQFERKNETRQLCQIFDALTNT